MNRNSDELGKIGLTQRSRMKNHPEKTGKVTISVMDYCEETVRETTVESVEEILKYKNNPQTVTWITVDGVHDPKIIEDFGKYFGIHPLVLEDIESAEHRPKIDEFEDSIFIVAKMLYHEKKSGLIYSENLNVIIGNGYLISFLEDPGDIFDGIRSEIRNSKGRTRSAGSDYLAARLLDIVVDNYYVIPERLGEGIAMVEEELIKNPTSSTLHTIQKIKREMLYLRSSVWPLREAIGHLERGESTLINDKTRPYFGDVYDHIIQVIDTNETIRDTITGMLDIYLSSVSYKLNEVMKVLTIIATIFMPLTFLAGIYGMNFQYMPELSIPWAYPAVWGTMIVTALLMLRYFRKKGWI